LETYFIPKNYGAPAPTLIAADEVTNYTSSVDLINAVKVSGRTEKGLGIGFLNAITEKHMQQ
jgi:hypothetical protein